MTQRIYGAGEFSKASSDLIAITGISFRLNETASSLDTVIPNLTFQMDTYQGSMLEITETSWNDTLANPTTVLSRRNLALRGEAMSDPTMFQVHFTLDQPYVYDRNLGHLVLRMVFDGQSGGRAFDFERTDQERGAYLFYFTLSDPAIAPGSLVTRFSYVPIPEPKTFLILCLGISCILAERKLKVIRR